MKEEIPNHFSIENFTHSGNGLKIKTYKIRGSILNDIRKIEDIHGKMTDVKDADLIFCYQHFTENEMKESFVNHGNTDIMMIPSIAKAQIINNALSEGRAPILDLFHWGLKSPTSHINKSFKNNFLVVTSNNTENKTFYKFLNVGSYTDGVLRTDHHRQPIADKNHECDQYIFYHSLDDTETAIKYHKKQNIEREYFIMNANVLY